jgi:hypothetical protein
MVAHWSAWETQRTVPRAVEMVTAMTAVRQVEGSVRSLVHSALRILLVAGVRTGAAGEVKRVESMV